MMRTLRSAVALASAFLYAGCMAAPGSDAVVNRSWPAAGLELVELESTNGTVHVRAGNTASVTMTARVHGPRASHVAGEELRTEISGKTLRIRDRSSRRHRVFVFPLIGNSNRITYELTVPPKMMMDVTNVNGKIDVHGVEGRSELSSVNGSIQISSPGAELVARTVNGAVRAEFLNSFHGARLKTVNGSISVTLPKNASFDFDVSQVNGSFKSNVPMTVRRSGRNSEGSVNGGEFSLQLTTVNGSVSVHQRAENEPTHSDTVE